MVTDILIAIAVYFWLAGALFGILFRFTDDVVEPPMLALLVIFWPVVLAFYIGWLAVFLTMLAFSPVTGISPRKPFR